MRRWSRQFAIVLTLAVGLNGVARVAVAAPDDPKMTSTNYSVIESEEGASGRCAGSSDFAQCLEQVSSNYNFTPTSDDGGSTLGQTIGGGGSSSTNYSTGETTGFNTTGQPALMLVVNTSSVDFGVLNSGAATFRTATFDVTNYTSNKYAVQVVGTAPTYNGHALTALTTDTASSAGTEQFGINMVLNTSAGVGANPAAPPNGINSLGVAGDGATGTYGSTRPYTIPDAYRFVSGETVASAPSSSGDTRYTMTLMANIHATGTPSGAYTGNLDILVTGTY